MMKHEMRSDLWLDFLTDTEFLTPVGLSQLMRCPEFLQQVTQLQKQGKAPHTFQVTMRAYIHILQWLTLSGHNNN